MKLWRLQPLFRDLAKRWSLDFELTQGWPGIALVRRRLLLERRLELRLQADFLSDEREFYEFHFVEIGPRITGIGLRHDFGCGRLLDDEVLSEPRVTRELREKAYLLGLVKGRRQVSSRGARPVFARRRSGRRVVKSG